MFVPRRKLSNTIHRLRSAAHAINFCVYRIAGIKSNSAIFLKERDFSIFDAIIARPILGCNHLIMFYARPGLASVIRDLGVMFDSQLTMKAHISSLTRVFFYQLRRLRTIRRCVDQSTM